CHRPAELFGNHRQIGNTAARDAATAQFLRNEQTRPPEFGGPPPPCRVEGRTRGMQLPDVAKRRFFLQKCLGGRGEQYLFGRVDGHDAGPWGGKFGWVIIRLIGPGRSSLETLMVAISNTV